MGIRVEYKDMPGQRLTREVAVLPANTDKWLVIGTVTERHGLWTAKLRWSFRRLGAPWFGSRADAAKWLLINENLGVIPPGHGELTPVLPGFGAKTDETVLSSVHQAAA